MNKLNTIDLIKKLVDIPSPSGYTSNIMEYISDLIPSNRYQVTRTNKGAMIICTQANPELLISVHVDTLGGMVKFLNDDGTLEITQIGGWPPNSFEGEYVSILTQNYQIYRGTFLINNPAAHVNRDVSKTERKMEKMHIRVDAITDSKKKTKKLGIEIGDLIFFDPRFENTDTGFVKSRFMDDKACSGIVLDIILNHFNDIKDKPVGFFFSNYEEVGHGGSAGIPSSVKQLLVADMGVVGDKVEGRETAVSICAKDSNGPYDYSMRCELVKLARKNKLPYLVDIFPYYGSDGGAALAAGMDLQVALIGPGVSSSHGVECTHIKGINATKDLILAYIKN